MRVAAIQLDLAWENVAENHRRAERKIQEAAALGARLVVLPELFCCGFSMTAPAQARPGGESEAFLREVAEGLGVWLIAGVPERAGEGLPQNNALLVGPDGSVQRYTKLHPFSFANEGQYYAPGESVVVWEVDGLKIAPFICYDLRFPEVFRQVAGVDMYVVIASWPERRRSHWQALLRARAIENLAFVVGVNRVGEGGGLNYAGDTVILDPWGEVRVSASQREAVVVGEVDPREVAEIRAGFPVLGDRRP